MRSPLTLERGIRSSMKTRYAAPSICCSYVPAPSSARSGISSSRRLRPTQPLSRAATIMPSASAITVSYGSCFSIALKRSELTSMTRMPLERYSGNGIRRTRLSCLPLSTDSPET